MNLLNKWAVVGVNHYALETKQCLYRAMMHDAYHAQEKEPDDDYPWNRLMREREDARRERAGAGVFNFTKEM